MVEELKKQLMLLIESRGQTIKNYESLLKYYQTQLGWSEEQALKYVISMFDNGTMDEIIALGKGDKK
mgnify:FL=1